MHPIWQWHNYAGIIKRNLLFHCCPQRDNDLWKASVRQLDRRWHVFTGRKIVAVPQGDMIHSVDVVRQEFRRDDLEIITLPNSTELRETASFHQLLSMVESLDESEATFYCHSKGTGKSEPNTRLAVEYWRNAMFHHLLDHLQVVREALLVAPAVGTMKLIWSATPEDECPFPNNLEIKYRWMFAGTFFWIRHSEIFQLNWMDAILQDRYGAEGWLGNLIPSHQGLTLYQEWPAEQYPTPNPYEAALYHDPIRERF